MPKLTFIAHDGAETTVDAKSGETIMDAARNNNVDGIVAECGGAMACATCHCYVDADWGDKTGTASDAEKDMLDFAPCDVTDLSRLSCQITMTDALDGLVVRLPESQV